MASSAARRARPSPPIAAIVGPTGSGKTELSLALARRLPIEILVADSRQVYRGMEIGTAKPGAAARAAVPHHLLDLVDPGEPFSVADWLAEARRLLPGVASRGRLPLVVGGSGLYLDALLDGYALDLPPEPGQRAQLAAELAAVGVAPLADRLQALDPDAARRIDLHNPRRVTRALERSAAAGGATAPAPSAQPWRGRVARIGLGRPREVLYRRIDQRAAWLFANGLLDEVRALLEAGHDPRRAPLTGHGYGEAARHLAGEWSLEEAVAMTARRTRQYAKRQSTWFGRDRRIVWLSAGELPGDDPALVDEGDRMLRAMLA
ncbi:MAG: tRNA (adenosine(37)-N6)-dimethylallyltransferase MiaA [Chloroflexota bacterium]|nr:tRNA (adenosine(37)-N6)-dimethylallyltransferase MiaA [Chloroflexota bacterium]